MFIRPAGICVSTIHVGRSGLVGVDFIDLSGHEYHLFIQLEACCSGGCVCDFGGLYATYFGRNGRFGH